MENAKDKKEEQTKNADTSAAREMRCSCAGYGTDKGHRLDGRYGAERVGGTAYVPKTEYRKYSSTPEQRRVCIDERHLPCAEENRFRAWCKDV